MCLQISTLMAKLLRFKDKVLSSRIL